MKKKIRIDLFKGKFGKHHKTLGQFFQELNGMSKVKRFQSLSSETALYMPNAHHPAGTNTWTGELQYIRKKDLPRRFDLSTYVDESLGLSANQGLAERCHFAYRTDLDALALQSSRFVKPKSFSNYVQEVAETTFQLHLIIKSDAYSRLLKLRRIASVKVNIANPPDAADFKALNDPGVSAVANLLTNFGATKLELTLKTERAGILSLVVDSVRNFVDSIYTKDPEVTESVKGLCVTGKREDDEPLEAVDFIKERLSLEGEVGYDAEGQVDPKGCVSLAVRALVEYEDELKRHNQ